MKRIYSESIKKWAIKLGIPTASVGTFIGLIFLFLSLSGAITIIGFSGDQVCAGTIDDPCYAYINFTAEEDIFIYPIGYDPWGRETPFEFSPAVKDWKLQRSWGKGWRDIPLDKTCTGTWCGAPNNKGVKYSYVLREGRDYQFRIVALKNSPYEDVKWAVNYENEEYLDPEWLGISDGVNRGASWEETCLNGTCTRTLFSGTVFTNESNEWVTLPSVSDLTWENGGFNFSYRDYWFQLEPFIIYNGNYRTVADIHNAFPNVVLKDYVNFSRFNHKFAFNFSNVPQNLMNNVDNMGFRLMGSGGLTWDDIEMIGNNRILIKNKVVVDYNDLVNSHYTLNLVNKSYLLIGNISENYQNEEIYLDPTISLHAVNTENMDDTYSRESTPTTNYGTAAYLRVADGERLGYAYIRWNISSIPSGSTIDNATFSILHYSSKYADLPTSVYHIFSNVSWAEDTLTWNNQPCGTGFDNASECNLTNESMNIFINSATDVWYDFNVTQMLTRAYDNGDKNLSIALARSTSTGDSYHYLYPKEYNTNAALRPYLNITYSEGGDLTAPTYSDNSTNSTIAGTNILHSLKWADETALAGYIFSFDNGTGSFTNDSWAGMIGTANWSNVTKVVNFTSGSTIQWIVYANDSSDNWNVSSTYSYDTTAADTCTCPGATNNWEVDMEDNCNLTVACTLTTGNLTWIGSSGYFNCSAQLNLTNRDAPPSGTTFYYSSGCDLIRLIILFFIPATIFKRNRRLKG